MNSSIKQKKILALNSHQLSDFQRCETIYKNSQLLQLEPVNKKLAFELGTYWAKMLEIYYDAKIKYAARWKQEGTFENKMNRLVKRLARCAENGSHGFDENEANLLSTRIILYAKHYATETWLPVAVEKGFSFILYEDDDHIFIYEGRPDMIISIPNPFNPRERELAVVDHKTRARNVDLVEHNNQVLGYLCATKARFFFYNYCGKQNEGGPSKYFQRQMVMYPQSAVDAWRENTIQWYFRIVNSLKTGKFLKSMYCDGKYGPCQYLCLCTATNPIEFNAALNSRFKRREEEHKSW